MNDSKKPVVESTDGATQDEVMASRRRVIGKSAYVIPGILAVSVADLAKAQGEEDIILSSPPPLPNP